MMMGGGLLIGLIVLVLFLLLVGGAIAAVVWIARQGSHSMGQGYGQGPPRQENRALEVLRERYARGEIDREEFQRMREELRS
jgi:putative membrane protein